MVNLRIDSQAAAFLNQRRASLRPFRQPDGEAEFKAMSIA
jgi:hypothetical protein